MRERIRKLDYLWFTIAFASFALFLAVFFVANGKTFVHLGDAYEQYFPGFIYIGNWLRNLLSGNFVVYDFSIFYGEDVFETLNYYGFGDPINLLAVFWTEKNVAALFSLTIFLRIYLIGCSFIYFIHHKGYSGKVCTIAGCLYAFSVYVIWDGFWFYTFLTPMYILPLLLTFLEKMVVEKNRKNGVFFALCIAWQGMCGFYFLYFVTLFLGIYILFFLVDWRNVKVTFNLCACIFWHYFLGILVASPFLFTAVGAYLNSSRAEGLKHTWDLIWDGKTLYNIFINLLVPMYGEAVYSLALPVVGVIAMFLIIKKGSKRERGFTLFLLFCYLCPAFWRVTNGLSYASGRWVWVIYFWVAYVTVIVLSDVTKYVGKWDVWYVSAVLCVSLLLHLLVYGDKIRFFLWILLVLGSLAAFTKSKKGSRKACMGMLLCNVFLIVFISFAHWKVCGHTLYNEFMGYNDINELVMGNVSDDNKEIVGSARIVEMGDLENTALISGENTASGYYSILNGFVSSFYERLRISSGMDGSLQKLAGVDNRVMLKKILLGETAMQGTLFDSYICEGDVDGLTVIEKQDAISNSLILNREQGNSYDNIRSMYECDIEQKLLNCNLVDSKLYTKEDSAIHISVCNRALANNELYIYIDTLLTEGEGNPIIDVNGKKITVWNEKSVYYAGFSDYLIAVDNQEEIEITFPDNEVFSFGDIKVYSLNSGLEKNGLKQIQLKSDRDNKVEGEVVTENEAWLFLPIPYHNNWKAFVDDTRVDIVRANYGFMAIQIPGGEHSFELIYRPVFLWIEIGLSVSVSIYLFIRGIRRKQNDNLLN